jgi:hypothetical protein
MQIHRAVTLVVMMLLAVGLLVLMTGSAIGNLDNRSLIALGVVVIAAAAGGIAFSWKRYYKRVPRTER